MDPRDLRRPNDEVPEETDLEQEPNGDADRNRGKNPHVAPSTVLHECVSGDEGAGERDHAHREIEPSQVANNLLADAPDVRESILEDSSVDTRQREYTSRCEDHEEAGGAAEQQAVLLPRVREQVLEFL